MPTLINGQPLDLSHLGIIERKVLLTLQGGIEKTVVVEFHFSCHCYSRGPSVNEEIPPELLVPDGSVKNPRDRIYDQRRYDLSRQLVGCIDALIATNGRVHESRHHNFFSVDAAQEDVGGVLQNTTYFIFMSARKIEIAGQRKFIKVYLESAYPSTPNVPYPTGKRARTLGQMLGSIWAP